VRVALVVALFGALATPFAAFADSPLIVIGRSVGPIRIGMPRAEVVRLLGKPRQPPSGAPYYIEHGARFSVSYVHGDVAWIRTSSRYYRTRSGVGVGAPLKAAAALPGFRFERCAGGYRRLAHGAYTIFSPGTTEHTKTTIGEVVIVAASAYDC
jgi:hypothetical protein